MTAAPKPLVYAFDADFLAWLRTLPCAVCGRRRLGFDRVEAAHLDSCRYGDAGNAIPLCGAVHHREGKYALHVMGREQFAAHWKIDLRDRAARLWAQYQQETT